MKKKIVLLTLFILFITIIINWSFCKSTFIMYFYSYYHQLNSLISEKDISIEIPGGLSTFDKDWYPFVMTFVDENIKDSIGMDIDLTIMYNFGAFDDGRSLFYDTDSPYYSAFYGAYIIDNKQNGKFGFDEEGANYDDIELIASHDIEELVLKSLGCNDCHTYFTAVGTPKTLDYISYEDWIVLNTEIISAGPIHKQTENYRAYIQYGEPPEYIGEDFPTTELFGRIYYRYFDEIDVTIVLYVIAPDLGVIEDTDKNILSLTIIDY